MRRTVAGLLCLLFSCLPAMAGNWNDAALDARRYEDLMALLAPVVKPNNVGVQLLPDTKSAHIRRSLAIRCDDDLSGQAIKRLSPDQIEMLDNPTIWRTEMQKSRMDLTPGSCLS